MTITTDTATGTIVEPAPQQTDGAVVVNGTGGNDTLVVEQTPGGSTGDITYILNGGTPVVLTGVTSFTFAGSGNSTLTVDTVNGTPLVSGGIHFEGGSGANTLVVDAAGAPVNTVPGAALRRRHPDRHLR